MIVRVNKTSNYTVISNNVFKDQNLSLKARGLLTTILSLPDNWKYSIEGLASLCADGRASVTSAINELITAGYIIRTQKFDKAGKFSGYIYDIYEEKQGKSASLPYAENPITGNPITENQQQLNTNLLNTNILNTNNINSIPPISPQEKIDLLFEEFWQAYPNRRKYDKKGCRRKYGKIEDIEKVHADIMAALEIHKHSKDWTKNNGEYIPAPSVYLNQERWKHTDTRSEVEMLADGMLAEGLDSFFSVKESDT